MNLPPYGLLSEQYKLALSDTPMSDWQDTAEAYHALIRNLKDEIATYIWPYFDTKSRSWQGEAAKFAEDATKKELEIMI